MQVTARAHECGNLLQLIGNTRYIDLMEREIDQRLQDLIEAYVKDRFPDSVIDAVRVERDFSSDGDDIVNVTVVFGRPPQSIQIGNLSRRLWETLEERSNSLFPVFSFLTREEDARLSDAA